LGFLQGFSQSKGKYYDEAAQILNESVNNIRTVLSLGGIQEICATYNNKLEKVFPIITKKIVVGGAMFGFSNFLMFITFGIVFYLSIIFVTSYNLEVRGSLAAVFLIFYACFSAGNKANMIQDMVNIG